MKHLAALLASLLVVALGSAPATADSSVEVTNDRGGARADTRYQTKLSIRGDGFQVVRGGFGGVYVLFGWVRDPARDAWRPSRGGLTGEDYQYIPDAEGTADNKGYLRYVAFPGSSTAGEAAAVLSDRGGFSVELTIPGPVFQSVDRAGEVAEVDCREVTCGVITIGAHGVKSAANETFTPVGFGTVYDTAPAAPSTTPGAPPAAPPAASPVAPSGTPSAPGAAPPTGPAAATPDAGPDLGDAAPRAGTAALVVDRATAVSGNALTFSATGFAPGEQVAAVLDDGVAALGPLVAGTSGEVVGVLQLPADLPVGTHELRLTGAASGAALSQLFPVSAPDSSAIRADDAGEATGTVADDDRAAVTFLLVAGGVFAFALVGFLVTRLRRGRPAGVSA